MPVELHDIPITYTKTKNKEEFLCDFCNEALAWHIVNENYEVIEHTFYSCILNFKALIDYILDKNNLKDKIFINNGKVYER